MRKYTKEYILERYSKCTSFKLLPDMVKDDDELVIGSIDIPMTTRCNLRCKNCGNLMTMYKKQSDVDIDIILQSLDRFFMCVDKVVRVNVLGGEPFLYPHMTEVIEYLNNTDQVVIVKTATNGTVVPDNPRLWEALKNPKNEVRISHYEAYDGKVTRLVEKMDQYGIKHTTKQFGVNDYLWYDFGGFEPRNRTDEVLTEQYRNCIVEWYSFFKGKLYPCPRTAHAVDLGFIEPADNCIDCYDDTVPISELKAQLQDFVFERKYYSCCNQCDRGTGRCPVVPVAEQMK